MAGGEHAKVQKGEGGIDALLALLIDFLERLREVLSIILSAGPPA